MSEEQTVMVSLTFRTAPDVRHLDIGIAVAELIGARPDGYEEDTKIIDESLQGISVYLVDDDDEEGIDE